MAVRIVSDYALLEKNVGGFFMQNTIIILYSEVKKNYCINFQGWAFAHRFSVRIACFL